MKYTEQLDKSLEILERYMSKLPESATTVSELRALDFVMQAGYRYLDALETIKAKSP